MGDDLKCPYCGAEQDVCHAAGETLFGQNDIDDRLDDQNLADYIRNAPE